MPHASEVAARAAHEITRGRYAKLFWVGAIVLGHLVPAALLFAGPPIATAIAGALCVVGLYAYEHAFVMAPAGNHSEQLMATIPQTKSFLAKLLLAREPTKRAALDPVAEAPRRSGADAHAHVLRDGPQAGEAGRGRTKPTVASRSIRLPTRGTTGSSTTPRPGRRRRAPSIHAGPDHLLQLRERLRPARVRRQRDVRDSQVRGQPRSTRDRAAATARRARRRTTRSTTPSASSIRSSASGSAAKANGSA